MRRLHAGWRWRRRELREACGWGDTQLKLHLSRLDSLEYLLVRRDGTRFVYELAWSGEGESGTPFVMGLIDVGALRGHDYDAERSGLDSDRSAPGLGPVGPRSGDGRRPDLAENGAILRLPTQRASERPESTSRDDPGERRSYA